MRTQRQAMRHPLQDYASPGAYFVTVCSYQGRLIFGSIIGGEALLSPLGFLVSGQLRALAAHYGNVTLDAIVVMPNHLHFILLIHRAESKDTPVVHSLSSFVGALKSAVSRQSNRMRLLDDGLIWQSRFYDHVIRHEGALQRVRDYIEHSPQQWSLDRENALRIGLNGFYAWVEKYTSVTAPTQDGAAQRSR